MVRLDQRLPAIFQRFGLDGVQAAVDGVGPTLTRYTVKVPEGTRAKRVKNYEADIALALGKTAVWFTDPTAPWTFGLVIPNSNRKVVRFQQVSGLGTAGCTVPLYLGCDVVGKAVRVDLASLPHLLVAGRTGSGKSVCLHAIIRSITKHQSGSLFLVDPKQVEFEEYRNQPTVESVITEMGHAESALKQLVLQMDETFTLLSRHGVKDIDEFNKSGSGYLRRRIVVVDELADLLMGSPDVQNHLVRLAQKGRAAGIHLVLATQRPTCDVVTGLLKANIPGRICFQVSSSLESRVVLDANGAEKLISQGDFLLQQGSNMIRGQGALV